MGEESSAFQSKNSNANEVEPPHLQPHPHLKLVSHGVRLKQVG